MSLLLLIDGYNVLAPIAPPGGRPDPGWLQRERLQLIRRLAQHLDDPVRKRTCLVFDAANPPADRPDRLEMDGIDVRFAVGYPEADDLLEQIIAEHSAAKQLAVVSSDQRVQTAARRRGSQVFEAQRWLDDLLRGVTRLAISTTGQRRAGQGSQPAGDDKPEPLPTGDDVQGWIREFDL
jgi:hypothetical protein